MVDSFTLACLASMKYSSRDESPGTWMLYSGPEEIDACPTADTQRHVPSSSNRKIGRTFRSTREHLRKKPVIVNGATKSSARSQRDKTAFLLIIPFWPSSRFTEKEKERATMPVAALGRRTCFFFLSVVALKYVGVGVVKFS